MTIFPRLNIIRDEGATRPDDGPHMPRFRFPAQERDLSGGMRLNPNPESEFVQASPRKGLRRLFMMA